jgi:hypothetical protein
MAGSGFFPICWFCKHFNAVRAKSEMPTWAEWSCQAYPEGIPFEITNGLIVHINPYLNDNGIQFEKRDEADKLEVIGLILDDTRTYDELFEVLLNYSMQYDIHYRTAQGQKKIEEIRLIRKRERELGMERD